jgi:ABC-2 type transport system permease protein
MRAWSIALKDILVRFRERGTVFLMLIAPLLLAAIMGLAFGSFVTADDDTAPIQNIEVMIVNKDSGEIGEQLVAVLTAPELAETLDTAVSDDMVAAREAVGRGEATAAVYIPPDFSAALNDSVANAAPASGAVTSVQLYTDPVATLSASIVEMIVNQVVAETNSNIIVARVSVAQAMAQPPHLDQAALLQRIETQLAASVAGSGPRPRAQLEADGGGNEARHLLPYFAPSLAVFFLFLTMFDNISSILSEEQEGTLSRLLISDLSLGQILLGKIGGAFVIGTLQFSFLVVASRLFFGLDWGPSVLGLVLMVIATVAAVTSLGTFLASLASSPTQANILAGLITPLFAAVGGSFFPIYQFPTWLQGISRFTLNRWAIDGFADLTIRHLPPSAVFLEAAVLFGIAIVFFSLGVWRFPRRLAR